ncbi:hypothetical protein [Azohydromonas caseinilytica]|uniref:Acyl-CoA dehydrogenase n=1 Tax=Azohydromonas caseinilytica TaxID=2728836 RepID=A0A848FHH1_9BURK|nr:hypothetical protein [Azohydromonas caseinilytica]NML18928.1 hypothetical protein [Azohydromonas caseinilytica]
MHHTLGAATALPLSSRQWLDDHAPSLERSTRHASALLPLLARAGLLHAEGDLDAAVDAVAEVASASLAAGVVLCAQRGFAEALRLSHNVALCEHLRPEVQDGRLAGALALSGVFGHLAQGTPLPVSGVETPRGWKLSGRLPWVANLQHDGHVVAVPVAFEGLQDFAMVVLGSEESGLARGPEAGAGPRGIRAAALQLDRVHFREDELLHVNGASLVRQLLPTLLALQCGLALGVAQAALSAADNHPAGGMAARRAGAQRLQAALGENRAALGDGLRSGRFIDDAAALLKLRLRFTELAQAAVQAEQQAVGAEAVLAGEDGGCARRAGEARFLSLLSPDAGELASQPAPARRAA